MPDKITHYMIGYMVTMVATARIESFIIDAPLVPKSELIEAIRKRHASFLYATIIAISPMTESEYNIFYGLHKKINTQPPSDISFKV